MSCHSAPLHVPLLDSFRIGALDRISADFQATVRVRNHDTWEGEIEHPVSRQQSVRKTPSFEHIPFDASIEHTYFYKEAPEHIRVTPSHKSTAFSQVTRDPLRHTPRNGEFAGGLGPYEPGPYVRDTPTLQSTGVSSWPCKTLFCECHPCIP